MSLRLRQAIAGRPNQVEQCISSVKISGKSHLVYPSHDSVIILNTELDLVETLEFWNALPFHHPTQASSSDLSKSSIQGVSTTSDNLIVAWSGVYIVIWQFVPRSKGDNKEKERGKDKRATSSWEVHSTLVASAPIRCLDMCQGLLVVGTEAGIELWKTVKSEIVVWDRLWDRSYPSPTRAYIAPSLTHIAWYTSGEKSVFIHGLNGKGAVMGAAQEIRHPREIESIRWRNPKVSNGDAHLHTMTTNNILRIYSPVLDDPTWFQLLLSLDHRVFTGKLQVKSSSKGKEADISEGRFWVIDSGVLQDAIKNTIRVGEEEVDAEVRKILEGFEGEESDLIAWISSDGELILRSIINMDRKPPTLLKTLPLSSSPIDLGVPFQLWSPNVKLLTSDSSPGIHLVLPPISQSPLSVVPLSLSQLLTPKSSSPSTPSTTTTTSVQMSRPIDHFVRTPNGRGLLAVGVHGEIGAWEKIQLGSLKGSNHKIDKPLLGKGSWTSQYPPKQSAIFAKGRAIVFYSNENEKARITLQHLDPGESCPSPPVELPHFSPGVGDDVEMIMAVSDIDDGISGRGRRTQRAFVMAATKSGETWIWRVESQFASSNVEDINQVPDISLLSHYRLPVHQPTSTVGPHLILPVDPMGWHQSVIDWQTDTPLQDMVLTVSSDGVLEFWKPRLGQHLAGEGPVGGVTNGDVFCRNDGAGCEGREAPWVRSGVVHTGKSGILFARCSSRKKTVIVCELPDASHEMTIWDSNISEFSTGLELTHIFPKGEIIQDLDWTTTSDLQSALAVGFCHSIVLVCEQRMSYIDISPGWAPFLTIDMTKYTTVPINDSIWLAGGSLAVGVGNQIYLFSRFLDQRSDHTSPAASVKTVSIGPDDPEDIFQLIAHQNGPLLDFHPTMLSQCLLWNKVDLVKSILVSLVKSLREGETSGKRYVKFPRLDPIDFYAEKKVEPAYKPSARKYESLFDAGQPGDNDDDDEFSSRLVEDLVDRLDGPVILPLSQSEKSALATVAQATLEAEQQRRSLDLSGLRYLISLRMFVNQHRRLGASGTCTPSSGPATPGNGGSLAHRHRSRLAFRNIVWAMHSESQEILLSAATDCCSDNKMLWEDAKRLGVFLWLKSSESLKTQLEIIARNRFMQDEDRDPSSCSLIYFALGKKKIVHGLWRQAPGHKEQQMMLKFLANDFDLPRWKTAALKNAYALLSKQRYEYAAAFFMLAGSPKDALNVCLRQMDDWQMAVALARVVEGGTEGPLLKWILTDFVIPTAFAGGHRWLGSWAFWMIGRRDLAVRVLISPMNDVLRAYSPSTPLPVGDPENDDPSLLLLFQHLKTRTLQTAKGTSEISAKLEFDFVLHNARVFFRMGRSFKSPTSLKLTLATGCHPLALDLLRSWSFERAVFVAPTKPQPTPSKESSQHSSRRPSLIATSPSYSRTRRPSFMLASGHGRRESMLMDLDVMAESGTSTRVPSPSTPDTGAAKEEEVVKDEKDVQLPVMPKIGNLMKELKQDVQQGAMEFDMNSFF